MNIGVQIVRGLIVIGLISGVVIIASKNAKEQRPA
jgi:hypothetical protein